MDFQDCPYCNTNGVLVMSDGRCPNCKKRLQKNSNTGVGNATTKPATMGNSRNVQDYDASSSFPSKVSAQQPSTGQIEFKCPLCGEITATRVNIGEMAVCRHCRKRIEVPANASASSPLGDSPLMYGSNRKSYENSGLAGWIISFIISIPAGFICYVTAMFVIFVVREHMEVGEFIRRILIQFSSRESIVILAVICGFLGISIKRMKF